YSYKLRSCNNNHHNNQMHGSTYLNCLYLQRCVRFFLISSSIDSKNSSFDFVSLIRRKKRSKKSCESCIVFRINHIFSKWSLDTSNSSFLVPERKISIEGKIRRSAKLRSK